MQPRKCPHCDKTIKDDANYSFDKNLNLICGDCGKIAFPTNWQSNSGIDAAVRNKKGGWKQNKVDNFQTGLLCNSGKDIESHVYGLSDGRTQIPSDRVGPPNMFANRFPCDDVDELPFYS